MRQRELLARPRVGALEPTRRLVVHLKTCAFVSLLLATLSEAPANAQPPADSLAKADTTYQVNPIVITGTRTKKRIIDVPYAMERVELADPVLKYERKVTVDDVLREIPGLFLQSRYGNHDVRISMRGFGSRSNTGIRGVRILLDGIPESEPDGQTRIEAIDFQSLGSIEIVKGNASSLYTNAPGGVINFISDIDFPQTHAIAFNQFGSFGLRQNGFKAGLRSERYGWLNTYSYHNGDGYRAHSEDYWHIYNTALEVNPHDNATLRVFGYVALGLIKLPGTLTKEQFDEDPLQANPRDVSRDTKRISRKGRLGLRYESAFGENEVEVTTYVTVKYFERTAATYRLFNRDGVGASGRYVRRFDLADHPNEFSVGGDWFYQYGPIEEYENIGGVKSDVLLFVTDERIGNTGFYALNTFTVVPKRLDFLLTGRYDNVLFDARDRLADVRSSKRRFEDFTPKAALNYKFTPTIAAYTSYGLGFDTPAGNELDNFPTSSDPNKVLNPDLQPQHSKNFEIGMKGSVVPSDSAAVDRVTFSATYYRSRVEDEIVPFEVYGDVFFRNSAVTHRQGVELGADTEITRGLRFRAAYTLSDFDYDEYAAGTVELDTLGQIVIGDDDFSGNTVPSVPRHNMEASLAYEHPLSRDVTGFAKMSFTAVTGMYVDDANSDKTDSYQLVDPLLGIDANFGGVNVLLSGGVSNLFDETYVGFVNINSTSGEFYEAGSPRAYFVGLNIGSSF
jgi:iron complex outermembrane recepter protein